jgi:hypothetical protein
MEYPQGFPREFQGPVDAALAQAERTFQAIAKDLSTSNHRALEDLAVAFIHTTVVAFGRQACECGRAGKWTGETIRWGVDEFLRLVSIYATYSLLPSSMQRRDAEDLARRAGEELRRSDAWAAHLQDREAVATVASPHQTTPTTAVELDTAEGRRRAVDAYIAEVLERTGQTITRGDLWRQAGYGGPTQFQRWQRCDKKKSKAADEKFADLLRRKPHLSRDPSK